MDSQQKRDLLMSLPLMEQEQQWIMERLDTLSVKEQHQLSAAILRIGKLEELAGKTGWELQTAILHMDPEAAVDGVNCLLSLEDYTLTDLLKQELPEHEERQHTETVSLPSKNKDMGSVLALLPQEREFITDDGMVGTLTLQLDTVKVEVAGYGSSTKEVRATRSYPDLAGQDTQYIPKSIEENGRTLTLQNIDWQTDNTASMDGYAIGDRYTAVATYTGSATSSYVKGYTVTADYSGTVSRIALNKTRYVAIFEGTAIAPAEPAPAPDVLEGAKQFNWAAVLIPFGIVALAGAGIGAAVFYRRRSESEETGGDE